MSAGSSRLFASGSGGASEKQRVIVCYNCKGGGHMSKQCTKPKRKRDAEWFKDKALGYQNSCYLKKAQQLKPKLYDGRVIEKSDAIMILDTEETLMLAEKNFETRFVPQTELSAEQAFWSQYSVQTDEPNLSATTTIVEFPKKLPKVSMVKSCLKKLKFHLASFDMVVKERSTATAITKGTSGFEHTKACCRDDIIPFVKALKELFTLFDQCLIDEVTEVQHVFKQMELDVVQHCEEKNKFQNKMENVLQENDRLLTQALSVEIMNIVVHDNVKSACLNVDVCAHCRTTLSSSKSVPTFAELFEINELKAQAQAKDTLILKMKEKLHSLNGDVNERNVKREVEETETLNIKLDHKVTKLVAENEHLKQTYKQLLQEKVLVITALKEQLNKLKGKAVLTKVVSLNPIDPELLKVDVAPLVLKLHKNRTAHTDYVRHTQEEAATLREIIERNVCPLTRIATPTIVPPKEPIPIVNSTDKPVVTLVYSRTTKAANKKVVQIVLWYLDSGCSKHMTGDRSQLVNFVQKFLGTVKFGNDHVAKIMGYGDYQIGNVTISRVAVLWLRLGSSFSPTYLLHSKASKTKSWLWHRHLSHLNFGAINHLARQGLVRGLSKLKFKKDHLCSACAMGKSTKKTHKPKSEDTNQEKLYLLHIDLCGLMRVESVNGKKYILVIVDDYSRFTWVKFLRSKDETLDFIIKFLKMIHVRLKVLVCHIRTDNGTEFVNQTLRD
nr:hypothetical protein [Tanacetum cinerariifolium]